MSTRSQTIIQGNNVAIYRHSDGYPLTKSGVLAVLLPLINDFMKHRGWDAEYLAAQIAYTYVKEIRDTMKSLARSAAKRGSDPSYFKGQPQYLGVGIEPFDGTFHGDVEYIYIIKENEVEVRRTKKGFWDNSTLKYTKLYGRYKFDGTKIETPGEKEDAEAEKKWKAEQKARDAVPA